MYPKSILAVEGIGCQRYAPAALPRGTDPTPIVQEVRFVSGPVWMGPKNLAPSEIRARIDKTVNTFIHIYEKNIITFIHVKINVVSIMSKNGEKLEYVITKGLNYILRFIVTEMCLRNTSGLWHTVWFPPVWIIQFFWAWSFKRNGKMKDC